MHHKTLETKATVSTDLGEFTAIAAAYSVDRANEQIKRGAFAKTIARWKESGKRIPLHWDHRGDASNIVGSVDPASMREMVEGLYVEGKLDLELSEIAREAWRSIKNNAVALSFGYLTLDSRERSDGVVELGEIDLFEISITPAPANPDTRFLSLKSATEAAAAVTPTKSSSQTEVEDGSGEEPNEAKPKPQDPLRNEIDRLLIDIALGQ